MIIESRLLEEISYGFSGGPTWSTRRVSLRSGVVRRNIERSRPLHKFTGSFDMEDDAIVQTLLNTFNACRGGAYGFRFKNPMDYQVTNSPLATADGTAQTIQLTRVFTFGTEEVVVPVRRPNSDVTLYADGSSIAGTVDTTTGMVSFTASAGQTITWSGTFDLPVFFTNDEFSGTIETWQGTTIEVQLEEDFSA